MTKPQRFASNLRLSRLFRWLVAAAAIKAALLVGFVLEQPWPFAADHAPPAATVRADAATAANSTGSDAAPPLAADIARAVGLTAAAPAASAADARGSITRQGAAWAAEAQPAPAGPSSALPAAAGLPGPASTGAGAAPAPAAASAAQVSQAALDSLNRKQDDLNRKQEDLNRREQELKGLEQQMDAKLAQMQDLEARIQTMLKDAKGLKDDKLRHLVDVYTNMKAKQAATVLETLDEKIAVRILAGMRGRQAGEILTFVQAEKAAKLSEALTRMQLPLE